MAGALFIYLTIDEEVADMGFFEQIRGIFRDKSRENLCNNLQQIGVDAKIVERNQHNKVIEDIERGVYSKSLGLIEISQGNIQWINTIKRAVAQEVIYYIKYGIYDSRPSLVFPFVEINGVRKGNNWEWKGKDSELGIINRLNDDISVGHTLVQSKYPKMEIKHYTLFSYPERNCLVISSELPGNISNELWMCFQTIARHLLTE